MSNLKDSPEYKALTDSLDGLAERGLFCALIALFRSLFALLAAIKSGAILLPPPPVIEPRLVAKAGARTKGVDGRDEHDHDADGAHRAGRRVRRVSAAAAVARPAAYTTEQFLSHTGPQMRPRVVHERAPAPVHAPCVTPMAPWVTVGGRCFRNGLGTPQPTCAYIVSITLRSGLVAAALCAVVTAALAQPVVLTLPLSDAHGIVARNVAITPEMYLGVPALGVRLAGPYGGPDRDMFAYVTGLDFHDGVIGVDVAGRPLPDAPSGARGFIGIAFRIDEAGGSFGCEGIYIRPTNARADDQLRRNHSTQYFSYPGYDFDRFRREAPGQYESYVDLVPGQWTHLRIEVTGATARLYVDAATQPALIVRDLKRGAQAHGSVGLYVDSGTDGHFRNLVIRPQ